eukprot:Awhi_evm1s5637
MSGFPCTAQIFIGAGECNTPAAVNVVIPNAKCVATKLSLTGLGDVDGSVKIDYNASTNSYNGIAYALSANCQGAISFPLANENGVCEYKTKKAKAARAVVEDEEGSASYATISMLGAISALVAHLL